jgi:adenylate cyclase
VPAPGDPEDHGYEIFHDVLAGAVRGWSLRNRAARLERQSRWLAAALGAAIAAVVSLFAYAANPRLLQRLELGTVDLRFGLRGAAPVDPRILLVGVDDRTLASSIRQPPPLAAVSRSDQARVLEAIDGGRPTVIVEDIQYGTAGDAVQTRRLKAALRSARSPIVLATGRIDRAGQTTLFGGRPLSDETFRRQLNVTVGYAGFTPDLDGELRRVRALGRQPKSPSRSSSSATSSPPPTFFGLVVGLPTLAVRAAEFSDAEPVEFPDGGAWIDYAGPQGTYPHVSLADVHSGKVPATRFKDKIVIVGETSLTSKDIHPTPADGGTRMSGPEIQANAIATMRRGLPLRDAPGWAAVLLIVALALVPAALAIRGRAIMMIGLAAAAGAVFLAGTQLAFGAGWVLPVVAPLLALVLSLLAVRIASSVWPGARTRGSAVVRP